MKGKLLLGIGLAGLLLTLMLGLLALAWPPAARAAGGETFTVDSAGDDSDASTGDCQCRTSGGVCTLRAAIQEANACSGPQTIKFSSPMQIYPATALPALTDNGTVIDGSDRWQTVGGYEVPGVVLNGQGRNFSGLVITAFNCAIYGLGITNFGQHGVYLYGGAQNNVIGGPGTHQRNVISGNGGHGVRIEGTTTKNNRVESNYIGTNAPGLSQHGNFWHGVSIWYGTGNVISGNLIAANGWSGIGADGVDGYTQIGNNRIGLSVDGQPLGNGFYGIHLAHGSRPVVISNTIAYNKRGIYLEGGSIPWIYRNTIYGHNASASSLAYPGYGGGIFCYQSAPVIAENVITNNVAYTGTDKTGYGGGIALLNCDEALIGSNTVVSNTANTAGQGKGGGIYIEDSNDVGVRANRVLNNVATTTSGRYWGWGGGIAVSGGSGTIEDNEIASNQARSAGGGHGGGLYQWYGSTTFRRNRVTGNYGSSAVDLGYSESLFESNQVVGNLARYGVAIVYSPGPVLVNNIIAGSQYAVQAFATAANPLTAKLFHNTLVGTGDGRGVTAESGYVTMALVNNIVVSHAIGISNTYPASSTISADHTLFWGNASNGIVGTNPVYGDPRFLNPAGGNYHLGPGSAAIDAGVTEPTVHTDIDGDPRPIGAGYDIGADEARFVYLPLVLRNY
jgi:CSLREA domain-containing protein